ncbi:MAG: Eco57I restriction-modification methylase domain-containing protein [Selenomonadaceae bacterium]|nr:Eco57I restriction-modification methylase domain-containing protein [Selenomonadaceae bacterium]
MKKIFPYKKILPTIYAYTTPDIPKHDGWTKIGYTTQPVEKRISEQTHTADIDFKLEWTEIAQFSAEPKDFFLDHDFHRFLQRNNIERKVKKEWFKIYPLEALKYLYKFRKRDFSSLQGGDGENYELREEQSQAVEKTFAHYKNKISKKFLWNAKPRFGKTLTTYDFIRKIGAEKVLIVTNRPSIANSWFDDFQKFIAWQTDYKFISETDALKDKPIISRDEFINLSLENENLKMLAFYSLQDLKGAKCFGGDIEKHDWIKNLDWDLIVIDEAHEGVDTDKAEKLFDNLKTNFTLHLSGTPFKALADNKFSAEEIFNWSYADEQSAKMNWAEETSNPYENLPRMNLFSYQLSKMIADKLDRQKNFSEDEDSEFAFDLNEFFKTQNGKFIHEAEVKKFLDALTTQEKFPFSTPELRAELAHTFWLMYRVNDAKAMAKLLSKHKIFSEYKIVVAAGDGLVEWEDNEQNQKSFNKVKDAIKKNSKTITLSVGQLTTGVTIPEWTGVLILSSMHSATQYFQAAFRAQNPFADSKKFLRKENSYVFDFSPERTLIMFDEFANNLNSTSTGRAENIRTLLNFFPVLAEDDEGKMIELDAQKVLSLPNKIKVREVIERGFISNFLFDNIGNIFSASETVREILKKIPPEETQADKKNKFKIDSADEILVNEKGEIEIPQEIVISKTDELFGKKILEKIDKNIIEQSDEKPLSKIIADTLNEKIVEVAKTEYKLPEKQIEKITREVEKSAEKTFDHLDENTSVEELQNSLENFVTDAPKNFVETQEIHVEEVKKNSAEDDTRAHLRGFARTIPSFIMAYIDKIQADGGTLTLENFEQYPDEETFLEVTSITKADFRILRDNKFFNEIIFNDAIAEFIKLKEKLGDYFSIGHDDDIFNYIPPQKTNQIFTPREIVQKMTDLLEKNNPGIFDDSAQKFFDPYMKSGLFIAEVIKRLYRSKKISAEIPDNHSRLKHILENQIFACAPTEIIFNIATAYIFGAKNEMTDISRKNFLLADTSKLIEDGDLNNFFFGVKILDTENLIKSRERVQKFGEVFTPQRIVERMLNELPQEFFSDLNQKFLEPAAGEGAFLTEIFRRKLNFADSPEKILQALKSLFAIELQQDNLLSLRKNLEKIFLEHCPDPTQKILSELKKILHENFVEGDALTFFEKNFDMFAENKFATFDTINFSDAVIISNPPYQEEKKNSKTQQARPLYHYFVEESKKLNPAFIVMIIPSRWFAGGMGLDNFRKSMMTDKKIQTVVDYTNAKDCFPDNDISGGVCYFVWSKNYCGDCNFINVHNGFANEMIRPLDEFPVLVRYNQAIPIIRKVVGREKNFLSEIMSSLMPFGLNTNYRGVKEKISSEQLTLYASGGNITYIDRSEISGGFEYVDKFKVMISKTSAEHAGEPGSDGKFRVLTSSMKVLKPNEVCTHSYFLIGAFDEKNSAENIISYLKTKFLRFLVLMSLTSINVSKLVFNFVPLQDFTAGSDIDWTKKISEIDAQLYEKYSLSAEEIKFIEAHVKEMS